jgi:hypothetical protein
MTKEERAEMYRSFLAEEGYAPRLDDDGDVWFKYEGGNYFIAVDEKDEEFFRIVYPAFWSIENDNERAKVARAALIATAHTKVAKVFPVRDDAWASIEMFCSPPKMFKAVFRRSLTALQAAVQEFRKGMQE